MHANKDLLHEIFRPFSVADGAVHEVQQTGLIALHQHVERQTDIVEVVRDQRVIVERPQVRSPYWREWLELEGRLSHLLLHGHEAIFCHREEHGPYQAMRPATNEASLYLSKTCQIDIEHIVSVCLEVAVLLRGQDRLASQRLPRMLPVASG